ncbi:hypothetical protein M670_00602 [Schinkia azotoformans MEV2011]|uniref:Uncharacterized protein n=1 Tax=Schinkia azotoformans MEV2011 TaxID=1348973 RepID=A0A072P536_SCHAZ|nr:hypothetical protein [Schinkia azotoformans]KEF40575.1 hypothetical protein M670_00602 [Schinkia azotoformans MEV2011]MEC1696018.1 hypothetical protein [Schinkia azotoformans]MEC1716768.1 hypothetical protein [Schinkia azotoformans]MEC1725478.1 hypothetical protein [Schinkia azotoformans]MEC1739607.1 hypothetical protein [Schinkia azotoformans]
MFIKLFIFLFAFISGFFTISIFPSLTFDDVSFFISALILNPIRFFIGMIAFIMTGLAFSYIVRSLIKSRKTLVIDLFLFFSFFLLMRFSVLLTLLMVVFSIVFGILTVDGRTSRSDEGNS